MKGVPYTGRKREKFTDILTGDFKVTPSSVCRIRKIWGRIFIWLFTFRWLKSILIQSDKFHSVSVSYIGCSGSGFRPASSLCERFRQQLVCTRAHVKTMKLCVLTNSSPILMHFHFQILQMWLFFSCDKVRVGFRSPLKKKKNKVWNMMYSLH